MTRETEMPKKPEKGKSEPHSAGGSPSQKVLGMIRCPVGAIVSLEDDPKAAHPKYKIVDETARCKGTGLVSRHAAKNRTLVMLCDECRARAEKDAAKTKRPLAADAGVVEMNASIWDAHVKPVKG
jgi:hypothetical protein